MFRFRDHRGGRWGLALVLGTGCALLLPLLGSFGFWDPHELAVLERATGGAPPDASPFTEWAVAVGVAVFGSGEIAARLPLAILGLVAVVVTFALGARFLRRRVATLAGLIALSSPLLVLQSRQLTSAIGGVVGHTGLVYGLLGLLGAGRARRWLVPVDVVCVLVGAWAGYHTAGAVIGITVPLLAVAIAAAAVGRNPLVATAPGLAGLGIALLAFFGPLSIGGGARAGGVGDIAWTAGIENIAYGAFPWVALAPVALVHCASRSDDRKRDFARWVLATWVVLSWLAGVLFADGEGAARYPAICAIALAVAVWIDEVILTRGGRNVPTAVFAAIVVVVLGRDLAIFPDRLASLHLPNTTVGHAVPVGIVRYWPLLVGLGFAVALIVALANPRRFARRAGPAVIALGLLASAGIALVWIPALSAHRSHRALFDTYDRLRRPGTEIDLGVMGMRPRAAEVYLGARPRSLRGVAEVAEHLDRSTRAFAIAPVGSLCSIHQAAGRLDRVIHVLDENAAYMLLSNRHHRGEARRPGLDHLIRRRRPVDIGEPVDVDFAGELELIGIDMPARVSRSERFQVTLYLRVLEPPRRQWKVFLHFDRGGRRFQGDHWPIDGRCATRQWRPGDFIVDTVTVQAGNITFPRGRYRLWGGFFVGSHGAWTNMKVVRGDADRHDRAALGNIIVE